MIQPMNPTGRHGPKRRRHGEGTVVRRSPRRLADGTLRQRAQPWAAVVPWVDATGRRRETWYSAGSRAEAEAIRRREVARLSRGARPTGLTVAEYVSGWLDTLDVGPGTMPRYRAHLAERIAPTLGAVALDRLTGQQVRRAMLSWSGAPATRAGTLRLLRAAMRQAVAERAAPFDPTEGIAYPRIPQRQATALTGEQARKLIEAVRGERLAPVLVVSLGLGLRRGEALGMRTQDVDLAAGTVTVSKSLRYIKREHRAQGEDAYRLTGTKTGAVRVLPLPAFVADALRERIEERDREQRAARVWAPNDLVFCSPEGNNVAINTLYSWFHDARTGAVKRAGLPPMRWHDLRASTATLLIEMGCDLSTVQRVLGHANVTTTMRYIGQTPGALRGAADRLGEAIG